MMKLIIVFRNFPNAGKNCSGYITRTANNHTQQHTDQSETAVTLGYTSHNTSAANCNNETSILRYVHNCG